MKKPSKFASAGIITAIAASLCCIAPLLALTTGITGMASNFSWLEPLRPYIIALCIISLALAWYFQFKPKTADCDCPEDQKISFFKGPVFLILITFFAIIMLCIPSFIAGINSTQEAPAVAVDQSKLKQVEIGIVGMTCDGCAMHISHELRAIPGVAKADASYPNTNAIIAYDSSLTSLEALEASIINTGYTISGIKEK